MFAELTDTDPPALAQVHVIDEQTIELLFNEGMDQASLLVGDYAIVPAIGIADVEVEAPDRVRLTLAATPTTSTTANAFGGAHAGLILSLAPILIHPASRVDQDCNVVSPDARWIIQRASVYFMAANGLCPASRRCLAALYSVSGRFQHRLGR